MKMLPKTIFGQPQMIIGTYADIQAAELPYLDTLKQTLYSAGTYSLPSQ